MARAFLFVLDSFGVGGAPDAAGYGDKGADTFGHIHERCATGAANHAGLRSGPLRLPVMASLGLYEAARLASGRNSSECGMISGFHGTATGISRGKDTPSGHWEIAGVPVQVDFGYFPDTDPALPRQLTDAILAEARLPTYLGGTRASGIEIIARHGEEHMCSGAPIFYTSSDSVLQIAAHEERFGVDRLYRLCEIARRHADSLRIGRIIARPFIGDASNGFRRTGGRRDYALPPPDSTLLDRVAEAGSSVIAIGKTADIFAGRGIAEIRKATGNMALFDTALEAMADAKQGDLVFVNFVDFDTEYGHRRDVAGYAAALEAFDRRLPAALTHLQEGDLLLLTADHGCDPTWPGTDHTRERVPILGTGPGLRPACVGIRRSFADIGATIAEHLGLSPGPHGASFYTRIAAHA